MDVVVERAGINDAEAILSLQFLCYQSEAELYNDHSIPPLVQTLDDIRAEFETHVFLAARAGAQIIGSVRAGCEGRSCHIGRLIVHPQHQRRGLGSRLMSTIESAFANKVDRYELFTGHLSGNNLRLYRRLGYREFKSQEVTPKLRFIFLEKKR